MRFWLTSFLLFSTFLAAQEQKMLPLSDDGEGYQHVERFIKVLEEVRQNHPDADKLSYERLVDFALEGMVGSLDTFSAFYHPETAAQMDFEGPSIEKQFTVRSLGISLAQRDGEIYLESVREFSAAARAGLRQGDTLLKAGEEDLTELDLPQTTEALQGKAGQSIQLTIFRKSARREMIDGTPPRRRQTSGPP